MTTTTCAAYDQTPMEGTNTMSSKLISTLRSIANKPNASAATKLITARRICRALVRRIDSINSECRAIYREAAKLELARQRRPKLRVVRTAGEGLDAIVSDTRQTEPDTARHEQINHWPHGKTVRTAPIDIV